MLGGQAFNTFREKIKTEMYKEIIRDPQAAKNVLSMVQAPIENKEALQATANLLKKAPVLLDYLIGLNKYPEFGLYTAASINRQQQPQEEMQQ